MKCHESSNTPQDLNRMLQDLVGYVPKSCKILQLVKSHKNLDKILSRCNKMLQGVPNSCEIMHDLAEIQARFLSRSCWEFLLGLPFSTPEGNRFQYCPDCRNAIM